MSTKSTSNKKPVHGAGSTAKAPNTPQLSMWAMMPIVPPAPTTFKTDYAAYLVAYQQYTEAVVFHRQKANEVKAAKEKARPKKQPKQPAWLKAINDKIALGREVEELVTDYIPRPRPSITKRVERQRPGPMVPNPAWPDARACRFCSKEDRQRSREANEWGSSVRADKGKHYPACDTIHGIREMIAGPPITYFVDVEEEQPPLVDEVTRVEKKLVPHTEKSKEAAIHTAKHDRAVAKRRRARARKADRKAQVNRAIQAKHLTPAEAKEMEKNKSKLAATTKKLKESTGSKRPTYPGEGSIPGPTTNEPNSNAGNGVRYDDFKHAELITDMRVRRAREALRKAMRADNVSVRDEDGWVTAPYPEPFRSWNQQLLAWEIKQREIVNSYRNRKEDTPFRNIALRPFVRPGKHGRK